MINWFKYPFIRLLIPFAFGIWLGFSWPTALPPDVMKFIMIAIVTLGVILFVTASAVKDYGYRWVFGLLLNLCLVIVGAAIVHIRSDDMKEDRGAWVARLSECPMEKEKSVKVMLELLSDSGSVMAYFEKNERSLDLKYGDVIVFFEPPKLVEPPKNPEQFDYKRYLSRKGVLRQVYLKEDAWQSTGENQANTVYAFSYRLRDFLLRTMRELGIGGDEYAVAAAILLGYDETLPDELRQRYVAAGSMHILCVSGMHVGVVFMVFSYMLVFLSKRKRWQYILKQSLLLVLIWFYALLAGLAPSILRATIMLSFVVLGDILIRNGLLLNSLAASAFLLLCIDPSNLFNVGFLLSYAAVIGIVELHKPIYSLVFTRSKLLDKVWELTAVTLAAQIATAPLSIYYFHQFPMYFWLSNLFMGPISTVVIIGGMLMLLLFYVPYLNITIAWVVKWLIYVMNHIVSKVESLPLSILKGLYINDMEFVCLLLSFVLLMLIVEHKRKRMVYVMLFLCLVFSLSQLTRTLVQRKQMCLTVYSMNKGTAVDFVCGSRHVLFCDTAVINEPSAVSFSIENHIIEEGVYGNGELCRIDTADFENSFIKKRGNLISFGGKTMGIYDKDCILGNKLSYRPHLDCFLVFGGENFDLDKLLDNYTVDLLIIDGSIPSYSSRKIMAKAEKLGQKIHDIRTEGAFVFKIIR